MGQRSGKCLKVIKKIFQGFLSFLIFIAFLLLVVVVYNFWQLKILKKDGDKEILLQRPHLRFLKETGDGYSRTIDSCIYT